jgi:UDP-N-acetylmuramoylalanine--D-glutamate ligase
VLDFTDHTVLVLGLGESGLAIARWVGERGGQVRVADTRAAPPMRDALRTAVPAASFHGGELSESLLDGVTLVALSPGLSPTLSPAAPLIEAARTRGLPVHGEIELFARALATLAAERDYRPRVIGITGTNGKTTTTRLAGRLIERSGRTVAVAGNISPTALDALRACLATEALPEVWVLELSSFQLASTESLVCDAATVLNVTQDHLDWHGTMDAYAAAKARIFARHTVRVLNRDDDRVRVMQALPLPLAKPARAARVGKGAQALRATTPAATAVMPVPSTAAPDASADARSPMLAAFWPWSTMTAAMTSAARAEPHVDSPVAANGSIDVTDADAERPLAERIYEAEQLARQRAARAEKAPPPPVTFGAGAPTQPDEYGLVRDGGITWLAYTEDLNLGHRRRKAAGELPGIDGEVFVHRLMPVDALQIRGRHNALNALAALALARAIGCPLAPMLHALRDYRGEPHRIEPIGTVDGVDFYDDSKGTNVGATVAALEGLGAEGRRMVAILGGDGKGQDFAPLVAPLAAHARAVVLIGRDGPAIGALLAQAPYPVESAATLPEAVQRAARLAHGGDVVLLSPACASLDMFRNYAHRAEVFVEAVRALVAEKGAVL